MCFESGDKRWVRYRGHISDLRPPFLVVSALKEHSCLVQDHTQFRERNLQPQTCSAANGLSENLMRGKALQGTHQIPIELDTKFFYKRSAGRSFAGNMPFREHLFRTDPYEFVARDGIQCDAQAKINLQPMIFKLLPCVSKAEHKGIGNTTDHEQACW